MRATDPASIGAKALVASAPVSGWLRAGLAGLLLLWMAGCQTPAPIDEPAAPGAEDGADALLKSPMVAALRQAAEALDKADWSSAQALLDQLDPARLTASDARLYQASRLALALGLNDLPLAQQIRAQLTQDRHDARTAWVIADFCERTGQPICALQALLEVDAEVGDRQAIHDRIWRLSGAVGLSVPAELADLAAWSPLDGLRKALDPFATLAQRRMAVLEWRSAHAGHPLARLLPSALEALRILPARPERVGLFLPLSGSLAGAGKAVRDGFVAAYLADRRPDRPELRFYDTGAGQDSIPALFRRAQSEGVQFIAGPLEKAVVQRLLTIGPNLPVLGLNYPEGPTPAGFRSLGLAMEDEAETIAQRLAEAGLERLLVIHNSQNWSIRGADRMAQIWPGHVDQSGVDRIERMTESVSEAMLVAASENRHEQLQKQLRVELEFQPRGRADLDGVVAFVSHIEALALAPALKFHGADELPVYASSQSVRNADSLVDLAGFEVADIPFLLQSEAFADVSDAMPDANRGNLGGFFALGLDAYRVFDYWPLLRVDEPLPGATGLLRLDAQGQIRRRLSWGRVSGGEVALAANPAPLQADG